MPRESCRECGHRLVDHTVASYGLELANLSGELAYNAERLRFHIRYIAWMCSGLCASCAHQAASVDWRRCTWCLRKVYVQTLKKCPNEKCGRLLPRAAIGKHAA
jgi:hypothetical protein